MQNTGSADEPLTNQNLPSLGRTILDLPAGRPFLYTLHRHRDLVTRRIHQGLLCGRWRGFPPGKRYGNRRRLDVSGIFYFHGRYYRLCRVRRVRLPDGLDGGICIARPAAGPVPPEIRKIHGSGFYRGALLQQDGTDRGGMLCPFGILHLCRRANARGGGGVLPVP